ncbi:amidohydrolase family protein [Corynebacterium sp. sy039]|uniref:amidohydrolase family protein n=1 Tax=Corynebacterium sp. sy039 TaxID=2599641 RepID=UPI0011B3BF40|nr:amidohydrolase family protein [Corynebacterium sp. sy039]QDZ43336.1 amidohydrolase family protein [Corynebacterium sp. sy039]
MLITNARIANHNDDAHYDIRITNGKIESITPATHATDNDSYNAHGRIVAPQFVEAHIHLDYANTAGTPRDNQSGTLFEAIEIWRERKEQGLNNPKLIRANAIAAARSAVAHGVGTIRTHVDVTDPNLVAFYALQEVKEEIKDWCEIEIVAFPQNGIYAYPGGDKLVARALDEGADAIGGIPHLEPTREDGIASLDYLFDLSEKYGVPIDIHCDEIDDEHSRFTEVIAAQTSKRSMHGLATISHAVAMSYYSPGYLSRLLPKLAAAQVNFAVCPNENLHLQGRGFSSAVPRGVAPIKQLTEFGINVALCQDSISDPWYPLGNGDLLRILDTGLHVSHMLTPTYLDNCLEFITTNPARNLRLNNYGIAEGNPANLIVLDATSQRDALQHSAPVLLSIHNGKKIFERAAAPAQWDY